jgi:hypothetical protein
MCRVSGVSTFLGRKFAAKAGLKLLSIRDLQDFLYALGRALLLDIVHSSIPRHPR